MRMFLNSKLDMHNWFQIYLLYLLCTQHNHKLYFTEYTQVGLLQANTDEQSECRRGETRTIPSVSATITSHVHI